MSELTMNNSGNSGSSKGYRTAFKATAIFGGSQIITIIISIIKSKLVAIWLGPTGMGLMNLFNTAINLVQNITNLGLQSSAVREIAKESEDINRLAIIVTALRRWVLSCGIIGTLLTVAISPLLSYVYFDNYQYTLSFILLAIIVLIQGVTQQQSALIQGVRRIKDLVKANVYGALIGFVISVPIFYFFRDKGIVPVLILTAVGSMCATTFYARRIKIKKVTQTYKDSFTYGITAVKLGVAMAISAIMVSVVEFVVRSYMARNGGLEEVGLYSAGWAINAQYLGLIFAAMGKDYYPRLSQKSDNNRALKEMVDAQGEIALFILTPMIAIMLVSIPLFVRLLYSSSFDGAIPMIKWLFVGSLIKAGSWSISFLFLAKGDSKTFLFNELGMKFITLPSYLIFYHFCGLIGIGYAYSFNYAVYFIVVGIVSKLKYNITFNGIFFKIFFLDLFLVVSMLLINGADIGWKIYLLIFLALFAVTINIVYLQKRLNIKDVLKKKFSHE